MRLRLILPNPNTYQNFYLFQVQGIEEPNLKFIFQNKIPEN